MAGVQVLGVVLDPKARSGYFVKIPGSCLPSN